ncbi:MAG TPA: glycosyl hydrolase [bacterium]|nr:glycosyl hydrolase [bacterium]
MKNDISFDIFRNAPVEYRPVPFLFLNHELDDDELTWQIKQIKEKGLRGFFMHPRPGLLTPYMSVKFREKITLMVEQAAKLGIEAWLYDEDPYPSGAAGGKVFYQHPEFMSRTLIPVVATTSGKKEFKLDMPIGHVVAAFAIKLGKQDGSDIEQVIDIAGHIGPIRDKWGHIRRYNTYYGSMRADTFPHWRSDATGIKNCLSWNVPEGNWKIIAFVETFEKSYWGPWGGYVDLLNKDAVDDFINKTHQIYKKDLGKYFGNTIPGIFTDEPKWIGWLPWSNKFPEFFKKVKGYDIVPLLHLLFEGKTKKAKKIRFDYWDVLTKMLKQAFFDNISRWCENNNISFTGHVSPEEEPDLGVVYLGDLMQHAKAFQIPGTDIITSRLGTNEFPVVNVGPKLISSVARQMGRERVLSECFALEDWDFTLEKMKKIADYMMALGVNFINPHGFYYSIDGHRKKEANPSQFYQTTYWQYYEQFSKYIGRVCYMLTRFDYPVEFALLYPTSSLWQLLPADRKKAKELSDTFVFINNVFVHTGRQFDFVDDIDFANAKIENSAFKIGKMKYQYLIIPPVVDAPEELVSRAREFSEKGGKILFLGEKFERINNAIECKIPYNAAHLDECERKKIAEEIKKQAEKFVEPIVKIEGNEEVFVSVRKGKQSSIYFFTNIGEEKASISVKLQDEREKEIWDPTTASVYCIAENNGCFNLTVEPAQSIFVVSGKRTSNIPYPGDVKKELVCKLDRWDFQICDDNVLYLGLWNVEMKSVEEFFNRGENYKEINHPVVPPMPAGKIKTFSKPDVRWLGELDIKWPSTLCYKINFFCYGEPEKITLVWEQSAMKGNYRIFIDTHELPEEKIKKVRKYDAMNLSADITEYFRKNKSFYTPHVRTISVFVDVETEEDGLIEPLRIFGDFVVLKTGDSGMGAEIKANRHPENMSCISWTDIGYPFYSGSAIYKTIFHIPEIEQKTRYFISFEKLFDIAEIEINGKNIGNVLWNPKELEITGAIKKGENQISIKVTNSIYNMLEGKIKTSGILEPVKILKGK